MSWKETCPVKERVKFIEDWLKAKWPMWELSKSYDISRKTAYKWIKRFKVDGMPGLMERSRAPKQHPNATAPKIEEMVLEMRLRHPYWGPRKLLDRLHKAEPDIIFPAASTVGELLKRHALVEPRRLRRRTPPHLAPLHQSEGANDIWTADFKGWFRTADGTRIDPLTVADHRTRYLIRCQALQGIHGLQVKNEFEQAFREYGLPRVIRTDNGFPFAGVGVGGLSRLSVWWIRLGIFPERIRPGHPQDNGRHERMHRSLLIEAARPPGHNFEAQQQKLHEFQHRFNHERPHEALGMKRPADQYVPSNRCFPERLPEMVYGNEFKLRRVRHNGHVKWAGKCLYLTKALVGETVGFKQVDQNLWSIYFGPVRLGTIDSRIKKLIRIKHSFRAEHL